MERLKIDNETVSGCKPEWETPVIDEVTDRVMAQPYIRFT